jgi:hypothetical protein
MRGIRFVVCAEAVRETISAIAKRGKTLDHHAVSVELEPPPHKLMFLNAVLSRIYAFLARPADTLTTFGLPLFFL